MMPARQTSDQHDRFRKLALRAQALGERDGLRLTAFHDPALPHFSRLDEAGRAHAVWKIEQLVSLGHEHKLTDTKRLVWAFLRVSKLTPPSDLLDRFDHGDAIDVYNERHQMIFASPTFLSLLSYCLEDVYCRPWTELFSKDENVLDCTVQVIIDVLSGEQRRLIDLSHLPESEGFEIDSPLRMRCLTQPRFIAPLFENGEPVAYLCVNRLREIRPT